MTSHARTERDAFPGSPYSDDFRRRAAGAVDTIEIEGVTLAVARRSLSVETETGVIDVGLTGITAVRILGHEGKLADMRVGMNVGIKAVRMPGGRLSALVVELEDQFDLIEFEGVIVSVSPAEIAVLSILGEVTTFAITSRTFVMWGGVVVLLSDLEAGDRVEIKASRVAGGLPAALRIRLEDDADDPNDDDHGRNTVGIVTSLHADTITVLSALAGEMTFLLDEGTIVARGKAVVRASEIAAGDLVEVESVKGPGEASVARRIAIAPGGGEMELEVESATLMRRLRIA